VKPRKTIIADDANVVEAALIANYAYERWLDVSVDTVLYYLPLFREWYYGMVATDAILKLDGVRPIPVSGR